MVIGEVQEMLNCSAWKADGPLRDTWVRTPLSPQTEA